MLFAAVDVSSLMSFLNSLLPSLAGLDPVVAGLGAIVLFVVQKMGGGKFDVWGTIKWALSKFAPSKGDPVPSIPEAAPPSTLADHETEVVNLILDKIKAVRDAEALPLADRVKNLLDKVTGK